MQKSLVPALFFAPKLANQAAPRRKNIRRDGDQFHIVDGRRGAVKAHIGGERRLQPGHAFFALKRLQKRGFLAADVGARAVVNVNVERPAVQIVLADELCRIGLGDRGLETLAFQDIFAANIDVAGMRLHCEAGDKTALDQKLRIVAHDFPVLAGAGLRFIGVDDEIGRPRRIGFRHEGPFEASREPGAAAPAQTRGLHLVDDPLLALVDQFLRIVPRPARDGALETPVAKAIKIGEDAILVFKHLS